ncbi:glycoside hydrolase family 32 protein [Paenibacillus sp. 2TAB23]|uniref:glycoside hydrolase family 32 protein n=1 Tax=Paenibacillus sp. 2TAB23 TaxID=3233004 RepID=UPI003F9C5AC3
MFFSTKHANEYIQANKHAINEHYKPSYHFTAEIGWINDPNGCSFYGGQYHLFYQYHPYSSKNGSMHWGHAVSNDLVEWNHLTVALAPDQDYDINGCFSGSAIEDNGKHVIMYTGHVQPNSEDHSLTRQTQCMAIGDGMEYIKIAENPVLTSEHLPDGCSIQDFRDPKLWKEGNHYYAVIGSRAEEGVGQILLYRSSDLKEWGYVGVLLKGNPSLGHMWECPDFFQLDDKHVLIISPQGVERDGYKHHNRDSVVYMIGDFDHSNGKFEPTSYDELDYGFDFYAPQTLIDDKGRRILIGWMQAWGRSIPVDDMGHGWSGMMTLPRELKVEGHRVIQQPISEIESYRRNRVHVRTALRGEGRIEGVEGVQLELMVSFKPKDASRFGLKVRQGKGEETLLYYDTAEGVFTLDRSSSGRSISTPPEEEGVNGRRSVPVALRDGVLSLRVFLDRSSVEVFIDGGVRTMSATIYPSSSSTGIVFESDGESELVVDKWDLDREG